MNPLYVRSISGIGGNDGGHHGRQAVCLSFEAITCRRFLIGVVEKVSQKEM